MLEIERLGFLRAFLNQQRSADQKKHKVYLKEFLCLITWDCPSLLAYLKLTILRQWLTTVTAVFFCLTQNIGNQNFLLLLLTSKNKTIKKNQQHTKQQQQQKLKRYYYPQIKEALDRKGVDNFLVTGYQTTLYFFSDTCRHEHVSQRLHRDILWVQMWI